MIPHLELYNDILKVATVCSGIGSPEQALKQLKVPHEVVFACEKDKYARKTYLANHEAHQMFEDMTTMDCSDPSLYADLYIGGIPCQAFSLAGKRLGELDPRGLLFYNFYDYVKQQQPKYFIIENVKGLLSDQGGRTFTTWLDLLSQSVNNQYNLVNHDDSLMYNAHTTILNTKDFGVPQNRERVFIVGIRNDLPNNFRFPVGFHLTKRLKDVLESEVDEKYYLSEKFLNAVVSHSDRHQKKGNGFEFNPTYGEGIAGTITVKAGQRTTDNYILVSKEKRTEEAKAERRETGSNSFRSKELVFEEQDYANCLQTSLTNDHFIMVKEATKQGYAIASEGDSINLSNPNSETRRGRVGVGVANTLDTACNQAVVVAKEAIGYKIEEWYKRENKTIEPGDIIQTGQTNMKGDRIYKTGDRIRRLTPRECFRLQGFPDKFIIDQVSESQAYKQAGNSITVDVIQAILKNLLTPKPLV